MDFILSDAELQYYYFTFYRILRRYRRLTLIGWAAVALGCAGAFVGWRYGYIHGVMDIVIAGSAITAGLAVVHQSVAFLEDYLRLPMRYAMKGNGVIEDSDVMKELKNVMTIIGEGGWQEAYLATKELRSIGQRFQLPPLE